MFKKYLPLWFRHFIWKCIPKFHLINTYKLHIKSPIVNLKVISDNYYIREVNDNDMGKLEKAHNIRGKLTFKRKVPGRMASSAWHGLAVFDKTTGDIAYIAWVIDRAIPYFDEFGIKLNKGQFLLKDGYCLPQYRHQGLHTRMEQERINYCVRNEGKEIFIQIHDSNKGGVNSVFNNGYELYQQGYVIQWPIFNIYRSLKGFFKRPFKIIIK
jgi:hypothetical protein